MCSIDDGYIIKYQYNRIVSSLNERYSTRYQVHIDIWGTVLSIIKLKQFIEKTFAFSNKYKYRRHGHTCENKPIAVGKIHEKNKTIVSGSVQDGKKTSSVSFYTG